MRSPGKVVVPTATGLLAFAASAHQEVGQALRDGLATGAGTFALQEGDIEAAQVLRLERAHRETEVTDGGVDLGAGDAAADEVLGCGAVALEDAVADETVADAGPDWDLAQPRGEGETSGEGFLGTRLPGPGRSRATSSRWPG